MKLKDQKVMLSAVDGKISVKRNEHGIPVIKADSYADLAYGLGWVHAVDRQLQVLLMRLLLKGVAAENLKADPMLIEIDKYMRRMRFLPDSDKQIAGLRPDAKKQIDAYLKGFNYYLLNHKPVYEFKLAGYSSPDPWDITDCMLIGKIFGFIGLADAQGNMEKFLVQLIQKGVAEDKLKELFPYLTEKIDYDLIRKIKLEPPMIPAAVKWLNKMPKFNASNNWAVSGTLTANGKPILCGDPHLEVNRLPSVWQEIVMKLPDNVLMGASIPGVPGLIIGRTYHVAWSATYSFMDMIDFRIEQCRDGKYLRDREWVPFQMREETIKLKKGQPLTIKVYENEHGVLEGDPYQEGYYLVLSWSARTDCGAEDFNAILSLPQAKTVKEAMALFEKLDAASFNWAIADKDGNIGYQMSGRCFKRPEGISGLLPIPAWDKSFDNIGYIGKNDLPSLYNPEDGIIATSNQDLNHLGKANVINLPMGIYRAERIRDLLKANNKCTVEEMKKIHFDLYSPQASRLMKIIQPLLPDTENGRILKSWDCRYQSDSKGATLFESIYTALMKVVFGDNGFGRDVVDYIITETSLTHDYYANFDDVLLKEKSSWFGGKSRDQLFKEAIEEGLKAKALFYGETRKVMFTHLLFGGQLPRCLGYDYGPVSLPGCRATISQGQIFRSEGRTTTFSPSYRMIADMSTKEIHTNIAGGPSDRRFSKWYVSDVKNWLTGVYKVLR